MCVLENIMDRCKIFDMGYKEVINLEDGMRLGYISDAEIDLESGKILHFIIFGKKRLFGILGREEDINIKWDEIEKVGEDIVLVRKESHEIKKLPERRLLR